MGHIPDIVWNIRLNYAREHLMDLDENEPIGLILCSVRNNALVHYAMGGIKANLVAAHYLTSLPDEETLRQDIMATRRALALRGMHHDKSSQP